MHSWLAGLLSVVLLLPLSAKADIVTYDFAWTGNGGIAMTGFFSFDSANATDGAIRDGEVLNLFFEGSAGGLSLGSTTTAPSQPGFNFNFNTAAGQFFLGGTEDSDSGQNWNAFGSRQGFFAGHIFSAFTLDGIGFGSVSNPVPLIATLRVTAVPEPATLALVTLSLSALCLHSTRRRKA
jgi:PEP-CTERM motif